ncbi:hypothetical protein Hypma_000011 [Hypsizygus marmoreus]|uniref:Fatty acid synthase meander beta sheet domain-containing protein n=1 Tax=Hypsizygus marmoreus TaxID=39966 RepID=A0A369KAX0_HYPMA|nr:hypothetical protein Hypma_000011 [Hypsizygus marmoreus]
MTYKEVVFRMIRLMFVAHEKHRVDVSLRNVTGDWLRPTEQLLASEDTAYFLAISQHPGQKHVPFVPVLVPPSRFGSRRRLKISKLCLTKTHNVFVFFKAPSLRRAPLRRINLSRSCWVTSTRKYDGDESVIPAIDYLANQPASVVSDFSGVFCSVSGGDIVYAIGDDVPEASAWLESLAGPALRQQVVVKPDSVILFGAARSYGARTPDFKALEIKFDASLELIDVTIFEDRRHVSVPLLLQFQYKPSSGCAPIYEIAVG